MAIMKTDKLHFDKQIIFWSYISNLSKSTKTLNSNWYQPYLESTECSSEGMCARMKASLQVHLAARPTVWLIPINTLEVKASIEKLKQLSILAQK